MADPSTMEAIEKDNKGQPKQPKVGNYDLAGLSMKWDNIPHVRQRLRNKFNLLTNFDRKMKKESNHAVERTIPNVKANSHVLAPVCAMIAKNAGLLPHVDRLAYEVKLTYQCYTIPSQSDHCQNQAWAIRHLISVLKSTIKVDKKTGVKKFPKDYKSCQNKQYVPTLFQNKF